jgi:hypothetical protein
LANFLLRLQQINLPSFTFDDKDTEDSKDDEWVPLLNGEGNREVYGQLRLWLSCWGYSGEDPLKNNNPNDTTLGCGRLSTKDAGMLAGLLSEFWMTEEEFRDAHIKNMVIAIFATQSIFQTIVLQSSVI